MLAPNSREDFLSQFPLLSRIVAGSLLIVLVVLVVRAAPVLPFRAHEEGPLYHPHPHRPRPRRLPHYRHHHLPRGSSCPRHLHLPLE